MPSQFEKALQTNVGCLRMRSPSIIHDTVDKELAAVVLAQRVESRLMGLLSWSTSDFVCFTFLLLHFIPFVFNYLCNNVYVFI